MGQARTCVISNFMITGILSHYFTQEHLRIEDLLCIEESASLCSNEKELLQMVDIAEYTRKKYKFKTEKVKVYI